MIHLMALAYLVSQPAVAEYTGYIDYLPMRSPHSVKELWRKAKDRSPQFKLAEVRSEHVNARRQIAWSQILPQAEIGLNASRGSVGAPSQALFNGDLSSSQRIGEGIGLSLRYQVYDFGRTGAQLALIEGESEGKKVEDLRDESEFARGFYRDLLACIGAEAKSDLQGEKAAESKNSLQKFEQLVSSRKKTELELSLLRSQLLEQQLELEDNLAQLQASRKRLSGWVGEELQRCAKVSEFETYFPKLQSDRMKKNPALKRRRAQVAADSTTKLETQALAEYLPRLWVQVSGGVYRSDRLTTPFHYAVTALFQMPLFDGFKTPGEVKRARAEGALADKRFNVEQQNEKQWFNQWEESLSRAYRRQEFLEKSLSELDRALEEAQNRSAASDSQASEIREATKNRVKLRLKLIDAVTEKLWTLAQPYFETGDLSFLEE